MVGLNAVMTHGMRGASDQTEWILIGVPRTDPRKGAFNTIDTAGIELCLRAAGRETTTIDALRLSCHSRGWNCLRETIERRLITGPVAERVVIFDAAYDQLDRALRRSNIPGSNMVAYNVTMTTCDPKGKPHPCKLRAKGAKNIPLDPHEMRAIGYSRFIQAAMVTMPKLNIPQAIRDRLLELPPRGTFTTKPESLILPGSSPLRKINITSFVHDHKKEIDRIVCRGNTVFFDEANRSWRMN